MGWGVGWMGHKRSLGTLAEGGDEGHVSGQEAEKEIE